MMAHDKINFSDSEEESLSSNEESDDEFDPNDSDDYAKMSGFIAKKVPPKSKTPTGRGRGETLKTPMALTANMSEYEKIRQGNIAEREEMLRELIADFSSFKKDTGIRAAKKAPLKKRKKVDNGSDNEAEIRVKKAKAVGSRRSAGIPGEEMVEGLERSAQAPRPMKRVNKSRATSPPRSTPNRPVRLLSPPPLGRFLLGRSSRMTDPEKARLLLDTWETCTGSPPDLTFTTIKDGVHIFAHRLLLPPTSYLRSALLDNSTCCGEASQVFIDGVGSEALIAALKLLYYGECELRDVSEDKVKEAANLLGFLPSKDDSASRASLLAFHQDSPPQADPWGSGGEAVSGGLYPNLAGAGAGDPGTAQPQQARASLAPVDPFSPGSPVKTGRREDLLAADWSSGGAANCNGGALGGAGGSPSHVAPQAAANPCESETPKLVPNVGNGADFDDWSWTQTSETVRIRVTLPCAVESKACVKVKLRRGSHLKVVVRQGPTVIDNKLDRKAKLGPMSGYIDPLESGLGHKLGSKSGWSLVEKKYVVILLKKVERGVSWRKLFTTDPEIDVKEVERRQNLEGAERFSLERALEQKVAKEDGTMCRVEGCGKKFVHCWQRLEHEGSVHGGKRLHCDICDKTYALSAKTSLLYHKLAAHNIEITCTKCPSLSFTDYQAYIVHRKECRKLALPSEYVGGHSKSAYNSNRVRLGTSQPGSNWLSSLSGYTLCTLCDKTILTKNMSRHMRELHNKEVDNENNSSVTDLEKKPNKCSVCDKKFKYERNVARHMKNVHAESA